MIGKTMLKLVDEYHEKVYETNPLFRSARQGLVSAEDFKRFLANIHYLVRHTPVHLIAAEKSANRHGRTALAEYFHHKLSEEEGHDAWAEEDIKGFVARGVRPPDSSDLSDGMLAMIRFNEKNIEQNPALYLSHILFAEYFTVIATPPMLVELEEKCGLPSELMSVITNHAELDKEHVAEWEEVLPQVIDEKMEGTALLRSLDMTIALYQGFCMDLMRRQKAA